MVVPSHPTVVVATAPPSPASPSSQTSPSSSAHLGTVHGVFVPSVQSILGVILFLRLTHITSQAGCLHTTLLLLISSASTLLTWSSLSAIVTNGQIASASGPYYIISRTLGADIGCSLGLLFYVGNTLSCSMFVLGAAEAVQHSIRSYYARWGYGFSGHVFRYDVQVLSLVLVLSMAACVHVGARYATMFGNLFFCVTLTSISCTFVGCILFAMGLDDGDLQPYDRAFMDNLWPRYEPDPYTGLTPSFFSCLALVYPCITGMLSGMSRSLHLKAPGKSIPKGTFWAIITCTLVYLAVTWLFGMTISNRTLKVDKFVTASVSYPHELIVRMGVVVSCLGLILGSLSNSPHMIAAMSYDDVLPFLSFLREGNENDEPIKALWFTVLLVALPTLGGNLDRVSPYATIFYLLMYSGINLATCISGYVKPPGFRPTFRYFHWGTSFVGFVYCLGLSFCINAVDTFVSMLTFLLMYAYIKKARRLAKSGMKWGTVGNAVRYAMVSSVLNSLAKSAANSASVPTEVTLSMSEEGRGLKRANSSHTFSSDGSVLAGNLDAGEEWVNFQPSSDFHAKNWRPQLLTIMDVDHNGTPINLHLMSLAAQLQQTGRGINVVVSIIDRSRRTKAASVASAMDDICAEVALQSEDASITSDITGSLAPAHDRWQNEEESLSLTSSGVDHQDTIKLIQRSKALLMLQMKREGMDGFAEVSTTDGKFFEAVWSAVIHTGLGPLSPNTILLCMPSFLALLDSKTENGKMSIAHEQDTTKAEAYLRTISGILNLGKAVILFKGTTTFPRNGDMIPERGTIDIWWIVHDGGLLLLLPFLLSRHAVWAGKGSEDEKKKDRKKRLRLGAKVRLFAVTTTHQENPEKLHAAVVHHLELLRIDAEVVVIDCLAGTNIAEIMRERNPESSRCGLDPAKSVGSAGDSMQSRFRSKIGVSPGSVNNPVASLRKDGISTHNMTLGEVFASEACEGSGIRAAPQDNESAPRSTPFNQEDETVSILNEVMRTHSSQSNLVVTNLPFIHKDQCAQGYFHFVNRACEGIDNVMLVRGSGAEVITAYA